MGAIRDDEGSIRFERALSSLEEGHCHRPADPEEFEFRKVTKTTFTSEKHTQEIQAHFSGKADWKLG